MDWLYVIALILGRFFTAVAIACACAFAFLSHVHWMSAVGIGFVVYVNLHGVFVSAFKAQENPIWKKAGF